MTEKENLTEQLVSQVQYGIRSIDEQLTPNQIRELQDKLDGLVTHGKVIVLPPGSQWVSKPKRMLLTGAAGFVGHHFLEHFLQNTDWDIVVTDSFRHKGKTDRLSQVLDANPGARDRVTVVTHDLTVPFSKQLELRIGHIDHIVAVASESHVDRSIT